MEDFSQNVIKDYKYWTVFVCQDQTYLGRCVIWCKREEALDLADTTTEEQKELFVILKKLKESTIKAFRPDLFNYSFLGNKTRHLHGHFVPRYSSPREFGGLTFVDKKWGHNYKTNESLFVPQEILETIRLKLKEGLK